MPMYIIGSLFIDITNINRSSSCQIEDAKQPTNLDFADLCRLAHGFSQKDNVIEAGVS